MKDDYDGAEPSGNSVATLALLKLAAITDRADFLDGVDKRERPCIEDGDELLDPRLDLGVRSIAIIAAGMVPAALGTDTAGSGRVPAALNGIAGVKLKRNYNLGAPKGVRGRNSDNTLIKQVFSQPNLSP